MPSRRSMVSALFQDAWRIRLGKNSYVEAAASKKLGELSLWDLAMALCEQTS